MAENMLPLPAPAAIIDGGSSMIYLETEEYREIDSKEASEEDCKVISPFGNLDLAKLADVINMSSDLKNLLGTVETLKSDVDNLKSGKDDTQEEFNSTLEDMKNQIITGNKKDLQLESNVNEQERILKELEANLIEQDKGLKDLAEYLDSLMSRVDDREQETLQEADEEEPSIALEDQLRIVEHSAKAIDLLSNHLLSTVWESCSKNTFGFFIRIMLLSGSSFKKQLIPDTAPLIFLGLLGVLVSAAMQIILAFYLWTRLPQTFPEVNGDNATRHVYPGTDGGRSYFDSTYGFGRVPLPSYQYPNYKFANDVCRTVPIVQLVTVGLFLFSILNNVPGVLKNIAIICYSDRFVSVDEEGVSKLHYWRESSYMRQSAEGFVKFLHDQFKNEFKNKRIQGEVSKVRALIDEELDEWTQRKETDLERLRVRAWTKWPDSSCSEDSLKAFICEMYLSGCTIQDIKNQKLIKDRLRGKDGGKAISSQDKELTAFANGARRRWMLPECYTEILPHRSSWSYCKELSKLMFSCSSSSHKLTKTFFDVCETRSFLAEALRLIDWRSNSRIVGYAKDLVIEEEDLLHRIVRDNSAVWPLPLDCKLWPRPIQFCDQARLNLVRIDYLKPSKWTRPSAYYWLRHNEEDEEKTEEKWLQLSLSNILRQKINMVGQKNIALKAVHFTSDREKELAESIEDKTKVEDDLKKRLARLLEGFKKLEDESDAKESALNKAMSSIRAEKSSKDVNQQSKIGLTQFNRLYKYLTCVSCYSMSKEQSDFMTKLRKLLGRDFADVFSAVSFSRHCNCRMWWFRLWAILFGVIPEVVSLLIMVVAGVQYILWSGFKVGSDTQGMEEIILATLAINFIYEIDDAVYDHVLPELYKEAHERDRFDITGFWISADTVAILDKCRGSASSSWWFWCCPSERIETETRECLNKLARCNPLAWESDFQSPIARGYFLGEVSTQKQTVGVEQEHTTHGHGSVVEQKKGGQPTMTSMIIQGSSGAPAMTSEQEVATDAELGYPDQNAGEGSGEEDGNAAILSIAEGIRLDALMQKKWGLSDMNRLQLRRLREREEALSEEEEQEMIMKLNLTPDQQRELQSLNEQNILQQLESLKTWILDMLGQPAKSTKESELSPADQRVLQELQQRVSGTKLETTKGQSKRILLKNLVVLMCIQGELKNVRKVKLGIELRIELDRLQQKLNALTPKEMEDLQTLKELAKSGKELDVNEKNELALLQNKTLPAAQAKKDFKSKTEQYKEDVCKEGTHVQQQQKDQSIAIQENNTQNSAGDETAKFKGWKDKFDKAMNDFNPRQWGTNPFVRAMKMSVSDEWNDIYLAHAYPFLYARKIHYAFANHLWESFLVQYGKLGLHLFALVAVTVIIVGGYRSMARCDRFAPANSWQGIFAKQPWPSTCLISVGATASNISGLQGSSTENMMAVSCGPTGYLPDSDEWAKNRDYFTP